MEEKFKTAQDVADWLEERGFPQEVVEAFIGSTLSLFVRDSQLCFNNRKRHGW